MSIKWPKIILFGDSQVQRSFEPENGLWGTLLANRVCDIITRGFSGYTSRSCCIIISKIFCPENVSNIAAFVICLGTNDSSGELDATEYHVPIKEYVENLEEIIRYLQHIGLNKNKIVLMTPGPYHHEKFIKWCYENGRTFPNKDNKLVSEYAKTCLSLAKKHNLDVINLYEEMMKDKDWSRFLTDGVHFFLVMVHT
ncbi:isoamyl acetate-hydrolyzing esterase 1 homolog [Caerostris extrusa]|uniref:Isoamyl acetate-hydrolyzing esterase 1 homolog n=1 Tax=Caerostris extrusa TaxID=172846 RepID=A0AAV4NY11_CAEEX|nr:isoamyl acetate-hydrolyzing esterase 1 homolog [Caerostris extrusa]